MGKFIRLFFWKKLLFSILLKRFWLSFWFLLR